MQRTMESKDSQLRELDEVRGKLRDKEYELFQVGKELEQAKALHTASLDSATRKVAAEMEDVKREAEAAARRHRDELDKLRDDIRREAAQQVQLSSLALCPSGTRTPGVIRQPLDDALSSTHGGPHLSPAPRGTNMKQV